MISTSPAQKGLFRQEIGRARGGLTSKIHAVADALGNLLRIFLTAGNVNDTVPAGELSAGLSADRLLTDHAYDSDAVLELA